jgi:hypothetical protein
MIEETYPYFPIKDKLFYGFFSEGVKGVFLKVIIFSLEKDGKWNLAFGDWENNDIDDKVMTNNQDVVRVIGTVAKVTYDFLLIIQTQLLSLNLLMKSVRNYTISYFNVIMKP